MADISQFSPWKILYYRNEIESLLEGTIPPPICLSIDPTNICNQNCIWCFVKPYRTKNPVSLSRDELANFIDEIRGKVPAITYSGGGDPLVNLATIDTIAYASRDFEQGLTTNGTPPIPESALDIISDNCSFVRVSIDAATPKTYNRIHKSPLFGKAFRFVRELVKRRKCGHEVNVSFMICPLNLDEVVSATELFYGLGGVDKIIFKFAYSNYPGINPGFSTDAFITKNKEKIIGIIDKVKAKETKYFKVLFRHPEVFNKMKIVHQSELYNNCIVAPLNQAGLAADGNIHLCCDRRGDLILGNIKQQKFFGMWGSERHKRMMRDIVVAKCPTRCRATDMNRIVEVGFIKEELDWTML